MILDRDGYRRELPMVSYRRSVSYRRLVGYRRLVSYRQLVVRAPLGYRRSGIVSLLIFLQGIHGLAFSTGVKWCAVGFEIHIVIVRID